MIATALEYRVQFERHEKSRGRALSLTATASTFQPISFFLRAHVRSLVLNVADFAELRRHRRSDGIVFSCSDNVDRRFQKIRWHLVPLVSRISHTRENGRMGGEINIFPPPSYRATFPSRAREIFRSRNFPRSTDIREASQIRRGRTVAKKNYHANDIGSIPGS